MDSKRKLEKLEAAAVAAETTTKKLRAEKLDARAAERGYDDRKDMDRKQTDQLAAERGYDDRKDMDRKQRDQLAKRRGFSDRKEMDHVRCAKAIQEKLEVVAAIQKSAWRGITHPPFSANRYMHYS